MDSGSIPPSRNKAPQSEEQQKTQKQQLPRGRNTQGLKSPAAFDTSPLQNYRITARNSRSPEPLPDTCPDWFQPRHDLYEDMVELKTYFDKPEHHQAWLDGRGEAYNRLVILLQKWDHFDGGLSDDQMKRVRQWLEFSLLKCPIAIDHLPRQYNHLNNSYPVSEKDQHFLNTTEALEAKAQQEADNEFIPEWMDTMMFLDLPLSDVCRSYWELRNKYCKHGRYFLTPEKLQKLDDTLYCCLIKFQDQDFVRQHGFSDDMIAVISDRLAIADDHVRTVNQNSRSKSRYPSYTWQTLPVLGSLAAIDARIKNRFAGAGSQGSTSSEESSSTPAVSEPDAKRKKLSPKPSDYPIPEVTPDNFLSFEAMDGFPDKTAPLTAEADLKSLTYTGPFTGIPPEEKQTLLDSANWFKRDRYRHFPGRIDSGSYPIAALKDEEIPSATSPEAIDESRPPTPETSELKAPLQLMEALGIRLTPALTNGVIPPAAAIALLIAGQQEINRRLPLFQSLKTTLGNLVKRAAEDDDSPLEEQQQRIIKSARALRHTVEPLFTHLKDFSRNIEAAVDFARSELGEETPVTEIHSFISPIEHFIEMEKYRDGPDLTTRDESFFTETLQLLTSFQLQSTPFHLEKVVRPLAQTVPVPAELLSAVNYKGPKTSLTEEVADIKPALLVDAVIKGFRKLNRTYFDSMSIWNPAEGKKQYDHLLQLFDSLILAYSRSLDIDTHLQEYQALCKLRHATYQFQSILKAPRHPSHTKYDTELKTVLNQHKGLLNQLIKRG